MARILIVEDSAAMRTYVRSALEGAPELGDHLESDEAASGFDALRLLPRGAYDLVITDINMPDINGLELIRFVRQSAHHKKVAVLVISTQSSERDLQRALALGADAFLAKPFTPEALRGAVVRSLSARGGVSAGRSSVPEFDSVASSPLSGYPISAAEPGGSLPRRSSNGTSNGSPEGGGA